MNWSLSAANLAVASGVGTCWRECEVMVMGDAKRPAVRVKPRMLVRRDGIAFPFDRDA